MNILHSAALLSPPPGIVNQMYDEKRAAEAMGLPWDVVMFSPACQDHPVIRQSRWVKFKRSFILTKALAWLLLRIEYHVWLFSQVNRYDAFVLRYYVHDPFQLLFLLFSRRPVFLVHHTLEVPELMMEGGVLSYIRGGLERLIGGMAIRASAGTIGVTREIIKHEFMRIASHPHKSFLYPNGIYPGVEVLPDDRGAVPELMFVAGYFASWHGLDMLLRACAASHEQFILHLVGELQPADLSLAQQDSRIVLHGQLSQAQIKALSAKCWLGLSSFALERKKMQEACTLKVREYLSSGLAVYAGHMDVFPADAIFFKHGPLDITAILAYAQSIRPLDRRKISELAKPYIDKIILLKQLYTSIENNTEG